MKLKQLSLTLAVAALSAAAISARADQGTIPNFGDENDTTLSWVAGSQYLYKFAAKQADSQAAPAKLDIPNFGDENDTSRSWVAGEQFLAAHQQPVTKAEVRNAFVKGPIPNFGDEDDTSLRWVAGNEYLAKRRSAN
ncbi:MAG: hypothetical protein JO035_14580 [Betaproteobacteria bacterium]|nr:hypothetical protein [Betaproteobacteria bacterium]